MAKTPPSSGLFWKNDLGATAAPVELSLVVADAGTAIIVVYTTGLPSEVLVTTEVDDSDAEVLEVGGGVVDGDEELVVELDEEVEEEVVLDEVREMADLDVADVDVVLVELCVKPGKDRDKGEDWVGSKPLVRPPKPSGSVLELVLALCPLPPPPKMPDKNPPRPCLLAKFSS